MSWATWLLFTRVFPRCVELCGRYPWPLGSCPPGCTLGLLFCVCSVLGHLSPVHRCARSVCYDVCAVSWATLPLITGMYARRVVLCVRSPGPSWLLCTGEHCWRVVSRVRLSAPLGSCSPVCTLHVLCFLCGVPGHLAPVHWCARSACCVVCAVSWATWLVFTGMHAQRVMLCVWCPGQLGPCSRVCTLGVLCCACRVLGHLAPVHRCARSVCCVACAVSWATWLLFTGVYARCVVLRLLCPAPLDSCLPVCTPAVLCCVCGVLSH